MFAAYLLLAALTYGGWYVYTHSGDSASEDMTFEQLVDTFLAQDDVKAKFAANPDFGTQAEAREELVKTYETGSTEERVGTSIILYALARNVMPEEMSADGTTKYKKSKEKPLSKKSTDLLVEIADRMEVKAATEEPDASVRAAQKARIDKERAAIDKAAKESAPSDDIATKDDLEEALDAITPTTGAACFEDNFKAVARYLWETGKPEDIADASVEIYAMARKVWFDSTTKTWMPSAAPGCPTADRKAFTDLADVLSNRAIMLSSDPLTAEIVWKIVDNRKKIDAADAMAPSTMPDMPVPDIVAKFPEEYKYAMPSADSAPLAPIFPTEDASGGSAAGLSPYTTDIGPRIDYGPGIWS